MKMIVKDDPKYTYGPYDQYGELYDAGQRKFYAGKADKTFAIFERWLRGYLKGKVLADVGCGSGDELVKYAQLGAAKVIGIEPSVTMIHIAAGRILQHDKLPIELQQGGFDALALDDESVDFVTARYSLHILSRFDEAFAEVARVLRPDGLFLVSVSHPDYDARLTAKYGKKIGDRLDLTLFQGAVTVSNATHTMQEYIDGAATQYFTCEEITEYGIRDDDTSLTDLVLIYRKK